MNRTVSPLAFSLLNLSVTCWAAAFSGVIHLSFLFCSPPPSTHSAARAPYKPGLGSFLGFYKAPCVHFHHICCLMLRHSSCKLLKIPYSAMRTKTSKCWTIVSLFEASPQAGLIACCSPPFPPILSSSVFLCATQKSLFSQNCCLLLQSLTQKPVQKPRVVLESLFICIKCFKSFNDYTLPKMLSLPSIHK